MLTRPIQFASKGTIFEVRPIEASSCLWEAVMRPILHLDILGNRKRTGYHPNDIAASEDRIDFLKDIVCQSTYRMESRTEGVR